MAKEYGNESISSQSAVETCRNNLPTYFGSIDLSGAQQSIKEILSNSIDEAKVGAGSEIKVTIGKDNSVKIEDFGRGLPVDWNKKENQWNWVLTLQTLHAGGKFVDNRDNFKNSTGLNGLGLAVTAMSSKWFKCESRRDGYIYHIELENGVPKEKDPNKVLKKEKDPKGKNQKTGTIINWKCDTDEVYLSDDFDLEFLKNWCKTQAILTDDVAIILEDKRNDFKETYKYKNGIETFAKEEVGKDTQFTEIDIKGFGKDSPTRKSYEVTGRVLFTFTDKSNSYWFHNSLPLTSGGSPKKAEETAFVDFFNKQLKNKDLTFEDIQENLFFISNTLTQIPPTFKNQTKEAIDMPFIEQFLISQITKALNTWAKENPLELDKINQQINVNIEARKSAKSQRQLTKEKLSGKIKLTDSIKKYSDCRTKDNTKKELFICLKGDTRIKLLNGTNPTIESLVGQKDIWAYSTNKNGAMIPAQIKEVFKTQDTNKLIKITFSDGSYVECTPEHKFLDRETVTWKEAKELQVGQSLFSIKFKKDNLEITNIEYITYEKSIPVYCLNIDNDFHSFVLDNGIITHNCEGDSANSSIKTARNAEFQATMPIRGKILNVLKCDYGTIFKSEIVMDLMKLVGTGIEMQAGKKNNLGDFNIDNRRFSKIIITTDQDVDGLAIQALLLTMFYKLTPKLIEKGYVYILSTPLFVITYKDGKKVYAYSDEERDKLIKGKDIKDIARKKGLGEWKAPDFAYFLNPDTRVLTQVTIENAKEAAKMFELWMGNDPSVRLTELQNRGDQVDLSETE